MIVCSPIVRILQSVVGFQPFDLQIGFDGFIIGFGLVFGVLSLMFSNIP